jgi:hypothetical protein
MTRGVFGFDGYVEWPIEYTVVQKKRCHQEVTSCKKLSQPDLTLTVPKKLTEIKLSTS